MAMTTQQKRTALLRARQIIREVQEAIDASDGDKDNKFSLTKKELDEIWDELDKFDSELMFSDMYSGRARSRELKERKPKPKPKQRRKSGGITRMFAEKPMSRRGGF